MSTYTTKQGDMWDMISFRLTGSSDQIGPLMRANPDYVDTYIFPAGVTLNVPELNTPDGSSILPPWMRE